MLNPRGLATGEQIRMSFDLSQAHLFAADTGKTLAI
jgi:multiple sugar transport system ATP-binding protein